MKYVGIDLHKKTISACVMIQDGKERKVIDRRRLACADEEGIVRFFGLLGPFQAVVEATAAYEWFLRLIEAKADRVLLAHPKKLRVIAESTRKTDKIDAGILAEFLTLDMIPQAFRPTPRQREHRALVRHRRSIQGRITSVKNKIHNILANYNADRTYLFSADGREYLARVEISASERFVLNQLTEALDFHTGQLAAIDKQLAEFAKSAPIAEREAREILDSMPCVGAVTIDVVISELGDIRRFRSQKKVVAYAGLAPGIRESSGKRHELSITKEGSPLLRWALVETAWRLVGKTRRWGFLYEKLKQRMGAKKAIVAIARRVLCVMYAMLKSGQRYNMAHEAMR